MNKQEFLTGLGRGLSGLPKDEVEERLTFYGELIDDRVEEGASEEDAVRGIGDLDELIAQITADIPLTKIVKERIAPKRKMRAWEIVLLVLGSPLWLSLLITVLLLLLSVYIVIWAVILTLWAAEVSLMIGAVCGVGMGVWSVCQGSGLQGAAMFCVGAVLAGLSIFLFFGCRAATKGAALLTKAVARRTRTLFQK